MLDTKTWAVVPPVGNAALMTTDRKFLNEFVVNLHYVSAHTALNLIKLERQQKEAIHLLAFLRKEYELDKAK
ncbi:MAG: hypothetical protein SH819_04700 [Cytophagales bacterium]|nr:hypothetical protein [Cytophagales bacterium]